MAKELGVDYDKDETRTSICDRIKDKMLQLEKYSKKKDGNKLTYIIIPSNHVIPFPLNLEDRVTLIISKIKNDIGIKLSVDVKTEKKLHGPEKGYPTYKIIIKDDKKLDEYGDILNKYNAVKTKNEWIITLD